jgi:xanthine dehydrogenase iron-sulfur cluster and FAD-binding subunit A
VAERIEIALRLNGEVRMLAVRRDQRLLDLLRDQAHLTGAKEGCGKGECGACTVIVDGRPVDSCLMLAYQADGAVVETIEGLGTPDALHPLQEAFVDSGASQCGACIPGAILAAKALLEQVPSPTEEQARAALAGNLCRCTGYTKMLDAVGRVAGRLPPPPPRTPPVALAPPAWRPRSLGQAFDLLAERPALRPIAGGTDLLVRAKDARVDAALTFDLGAIPELRGIEERGDSLWIGAGVTHAELLTSPLVARYVPALSQAAAVIGGAQVRSRGTLGGNLANASPAADTVPPLLAADAVVGLASRDGCRELALGDFLVGPGSSALAPAELIVGVRVPRRDGVRGLFLRLGQRRAQAISKVSLALCLVGSVERPAWVRVALGAVAPTVVRARRAEQCLLEGGASALDRAREAVRGEVRPIDDIRSTAEYRREMAAVLLTRGLRALS